MTPEIKLENFAWNQEQNFLWIDEEKFRKFIIIMDKDFIIRGKRQPVTYRYTNWVDRGRSENEKIPGVPPVPYWVFEPVVPLENDPFGNEQPKVNLPKMRVYFCK